MQDRYSVLIQGTFEEQEVVSTIHHTTYSAIDTLPPNFNDQSDQEDGFDTDLNTHSRHECKVVGWKRVRGVLHLYFAQAGLHRERIVSVCDSGLKNQGRIASMSDGTGVCSVIATSDEKLVIQKRNRDHIRYPGWLHVCGGMLESIVGPCGHFVNPFSWMKLELSEELTVSSLDIGAMMCLGLVRDEWSGRAELTFATRLNVPSGKFVGQSGPEHSELVIVGDSSRDLEEFVVTHGACVVPSGLACLLLYGQSRFGLAWYQQVSASLLISDM
jgi:hypothetical protein